MAKITPIIHVEDIDEALDFYVDVLECEIDFVGRDDDGVAFHSGVTFRGAPLMISARRNLGAKDRDLPAGGVIIQFDLDDEIDSYYERVAARGTDILDPIADRYWGQRSYLVRDPFGFILSFAMDIDSHAALPST